MPRPDVLLRRRQVSFDLTTHRIGCLGQTLGQHHPSTLISIMNYLINIYLWNGEICIINWLIIKHGEIFMESLKHANLINVPSDPPDSAWGRYTICGSDQIPSMTTSVWRRCGRGKKPEVPVAPDAHWCYWYLWFLPSNIGLSCKFSHHPILWFRVSFK